MKSLKSNNMETENENWNLAILTFVILILLFFWFYKFLFITDPTKLPNPIDTGLMSDTSM
jgi:succinate dehydrogenase hydrophobic anchor subunit